MPGCQDPGPPQGTGAAPMPRERPWLAWDTTFSFARGVGPRGGTPDAFVHRGGEEGGNMSTVTARVPTTRPRRDTDVMRANVFRGTGQFGIEEVPRPHAGPGEAVVKIRLTTICGTDVHIVRGEYPVTPGLVIGHETVGVIDEIGAGVDGYSVGDRVLVGAITPCGQCHACLSGHAAQCGHGHGYEALGGWRLGNTLHGAQAEFVKIPYAQANLARIPDSLRDEQGVLLSDIASTGFSGAESGG